MLSQFVPIPKKRCLLDLDFTFPENVYAVGRLDENSEGLLIVTNDKKLNQLLLHPTKEHPRVYWVQVQNKVSDEEIGKLERGLNIRLEAKDYLTKPCRAKVIAEPSVLPVRHRRPVRTDLETEWIELTLTEGKFHQVRKMCAAIGHQVFRLVRISIEDLHLENFEAGAVREYSREDIYSLLRIVLPR